MLSTVSRITLVTILSVQIAVLPGCSSAPVDRKPASGGGLTAELVREQLAESLSGMQKAGWRTFDLTTGYAITDETAASKIQLRDNKYVDLVMKKDKIPFLIRVVAQKPDAGAAVNLTLATYRVDKVPDDAHMSAVEIGLNEAKNLFIEKVDLTSFASEADAKLNLKGVVQRANESLKKAATFPMDQANTLMVLVGVVGVVMTAGVYIGLLSSYVLPTKKQTALIIGIAAVVILGAEYLLYKGPAEKVKRYKEAVN